MTSKAIVLLDSPINKEYVEKSFGEKHDASHYLVIYGAIGEKAKNNNIGRLEGF